VHVVLLKVPELLEPNVAVPVGVIFPMLTVSVTVAVQVTATFTGEEGGTQLTAVDVVR
jgi:hypothetical protein